MEIYRQKVDFLSILVLPNEILIKIAEAKGIEFSFKENIIIMCFYSLLD